MMVHGAQDVTMKGVTDDRFNSLPEPTRAMRTCVLGFEGNLRPRFRKLAQRVTSSQQFHAATDPQVLLNHDESIGPSPINLRDLFEQVSLQVATFNDVANLRFWTLRLDGGGKKEAQDKRRPLSNLLEKHQAFPDRLRRGREIHPGHNRNRGSMPVRLRPVRQDALRPHFHRLIHYHGLHLLRDWKSN
jgi:hypothetical protein